MKADQHLMPDIRCFSIDMMRDLAADVTDYTLQESFCAHYQSVKGAKVITDHVTGRSKGYGFGRFSDEAEHQHAMTEMNGQFCSSRLIRVGPTSNKKYVGIQLKGSRVASLVGLLLLKLPHEDSDYLSTEEMKTLMMIVLIGLFHYFDNEGTTPEIRRYWVNTLTLLMFQNPSLILHNVTYLGLALYDKSACVRQDSLTALKSLIVGVGSEHACAIVVSYGGIIIELAHDCEIKVCLAAARLVAHFFLGVGLSMRICQNSMKRSLTCARKGGMPLEKCFMIVLFVRQTCLILTQMLLTHMLAQMLLTQVLRTPH